MGRDTDRLKIVSMNASGRKGKQFIDYRKSTMDDVIGDNEPDILFLPGDQPDMSSTVLNTYREAKVAHNMDTVLLYDTTRVRLKTPDWYKHIASLVVPGIDITKLMYPMIDVMAPAPTQHVVKHFHCLSWHWELTQTTTNNLYQFAWLYVMLAQYLAWSSGVEVLIGGDFNLPFNQIQDVLQKHNKLIEKGIDDVKPFFQQMGYMDEWTDNLHRPTRRLRQLKLHKSKTACNNSNETDYFVASKEMQLCNTDMIQTMPKPARCTTMQINTYCPTPTKTEMCIPSRPPRHNGG